MRLGLRLPQRVGAELSTDIALAARTAEQAGFDSLWAWERLLFPLTPLNSPVAGQPWPEGYRQAADPLVVLAAAAAVTDRVRLGTSVLVAGLHLPLQLAKTLATVDQISGGRMTAGLGTGWAVDEFDAVGVRASRRGRMLDETLDVLEAAWGPDPVNFSGPRTVIRNAVVLPKPASRIPILLGGAIGTPSTGTAPSPVLTRIATRADGWMPIFGAAGPAGAELLRNDWRLIRETAADAGRDAARLEMVVVGNVTFRSSPLGADRAAFTGSLSQVLDDIAAVESSGADELIVDLQLQPWWRSTEQMLEMALRIREEVPR